MPYAVTRATLRSPRRAAAGRAAWLSVLLALLLALAGCELAPGGPPATASVPAVPGPATSAGSAPPGATIAAPTVPAPAAASHPAPAASPTSGEPASQARLPSPSAAPAAPPRTLPAATPLAAGDAAAASFSGQRAWEDVRWLAEAIGSRPAGSEAERRAAEGLAAKLAALGYDVQLQPFPVRRFEDHGARLRVAEAPELALQAAVLQYSAGGTVRGRLADAGLGRSVDLAGRDLRGAVALIQRGEITFGEKVRNVAAAGAVGALIYNTQAGLFEGTLGRAAPIPAVALSGVDGRALAERLARQPLTVELAVEASIVEATSQNVIATLPGSSERVVVLGGHYDAVPVSPGANDNASGTATALELARVLRERRLPFTVRVVLFGAEEVGLVGSQAYVAALTPVERERIVAMLNFDMVGVGDRPTLSGSEGLVSLAIEIAARLGTPVGGAPGTRGDRGSDHASFIAAGIPALFFYRGEDPRYHSPQDRAEHVVPEHLAAAGRLALALLERLAAR